MEIEISHSKEKIKRKFDSNLLFFLIGIILAIIGIFNNTALLVAIGALVSIMTGLRFFDLKKKSLPRLLLNEDGIVDNISWVCYGLIEWKDIIGFRTNTKFKNIILIDVKNEVRYLEQLRVNRRFGATYKRSLKNDDLGYGTPVFLDVTSLNEDTDTVLLKIKDFRDQIKNSAENI